MSADDPFAGARFLDFGNQAGPAGSACRFEGGTKAAWRGCFLSRNLQEFRRARLFSGGNFLALIGGNPFQNAHWTALMPWRVQPCAPAPKPMRRGLCRLSRP